MVAAGVPAATTAARRSRRLATPILLGWYKEPEPVLDGTTHANDSNAACHADTSDTSTTAETRETPVPERARRTSAHPVAIAVVMLVVMGLIGALAAIKMWDSRGETLHAGLLAHTEAHMSNAMLAHLCGIELHTLAIAARPPTSSVPASFHCRALYHRLLHV